MINKTLSGKANLVILITFGIIISLFSTSIKTTYQVFFVQMSEDFMRTRGEFAISGTVFMAVFGISSPIIGYITDRIGAKKIILWGVFATGLTFIVLSSLERFYLFSLLYGIGGAFTYTAISYISLGVLVDEFSSSKIKGLVYGLVTNGAALGFVFLTPLWLITETYLSWREIFIINGFFFLIPLLALCFFSLKRIGSLNNQNYIRVYSATKSSFNKRLISIFTNRSFYLLSLGFFGCGVTMAYVDIHLISQLKDLSLSAKFISVAMMVFGVMEFIGGVWAGYLCDKKRNKASILVYFYLLRSLAVFVLFISPNALGVIVFAILFGLSFMGTVIGTSIITLDIFSKEVKGFAFGFIWFFHQLGALLATQLGASSYDLQGNYQLVLLVTALIALFSAIISSFLKTSTQSP